ncbi:MAG TPA: beta-propeller domain-containing protein [Allosphingosinicella sp.]|nr:beta-propeller domain-containing protein [Allosphingosinicella sp.]
MRTSGRRIGWIAALGAVLMLAAQGAAAQRRAPAQPRPVAAPHASGGLTAFRSDAELRRFLRRLRGEQRPVPVPMPSPPAAAADSAQEMAVAVTGSRISTPSAGITNNQEADVDEGGIVKVRGNILVILRRGRLFTVSLAGGGMRPVDSIDAFPPGVSGRGDWYDEMLVHGDRVIVVGYSYARGGTEINRFRLDAAGRLRFEDAYHLRSNDYYSSRNYASRLIGSRLVFYTPLYLDWDEDPLEVLPGIRKWERGNQDRPFRPIAGARQIYIAPLMRNATGDEIEALHSVTNCDLVAPTLTCTATGVLGPASRTFYVSGNAVYLWVADFRDERRRGEPEALVYRLPFGRERPSAIGARGAPVDQFSFREDRAEGMLNVLVRDEGNGDAMGGPEVSGGRVALLRVPIASFGDGWRPAPASRYRWLPSPRGDEYSFRNRFVGDHVLYGAGALGSGPEDKTGMVVVAPVRGGAVAEIALGHAVDRIEVLGRDALVVGDGADDSLGFSSINLAPGARPRRGDVFTLPAASEGETRSHAFFFRPTTADGASGIIGLPIARAAEPAMQRFFGSAAAMLFLRLDDRRFAPAGELAAQTQGVVDDDCQASCTDWYGNARPIFLGDRTFALLGYELVEGEMGGRTIREIGRVNFAPRPAAERRQPQ